MRDTSPADRRSGWRPSERPLRKSPCPPPSHALRPSRMKNTEGACLRLIKGVRPCGNIIRYKLRRRSGTGLTEHEEHQNWHHGRSTALHPCVGSRRLGLDEPLGVDEDRCLRPEQLSHESVRTRCDRGRGRPHRCDPCFFPLDESVPRQAEFRKRILRKRHMTATDRRFGSGTR